MFYCKTACIVEIRRVGGKDGLYEIHSHDSLLRGITIFIKKSSGCQISNFTEVDSTDTLSFDIICPDNTVIAIIAVYAPSVDTPSYWSKIYDTIMSKQSDYKLIIGDYNVTINHQMDSKGYLTDPHTKSRDVITNWLLNGFFLDSFRETNPSSTQTQLELNSSSTPAPDSLPTRRPVNSSLPLARRNALAQPNPNPNLDPNLEPNPSQVGRLCCRVGGSDAG